MFELNDCMFRLQDRMFEVEVLDLAATSLNFGGDACAYILTRQPQRSQKQTGSLGHHIVHAELHILICVS